MLVKTFYDNATATFTHIIIDEKTNTSAIVDSVMDYDQFSGRTSTKSADQVIQYIKDNNLKNEWILETHIHADHLTAAEYLKIKIGGKTAIGSGIKKVLALWVPKFNTAKDTKIDGSQFDVMFEDGDSFKIGSLDVKVWHTPGHTPACASYLVEDAVFVGDSIFTPQMGTARCDFPGGSAKDLYNSIQKFYTLPDSTRLFLCHDYPKEGVEPMFMVTVGEQKKNNAMLRPETPFEEYVSKREARDKTLSVPKLLFPSIQTNMRLGGLGDAENNGVNYIKIPVNVI